MAPVRDKSQRLAPSALVDRFPIVIGQNLTLSYVSSVMRLCTTGYRQQWVDLLNELLEHDPHAYCVLSQRVLSVAGGRWDVRAAYCKDDADKEQAEEIADFVREQLERIPARSMAISSLLWGLFYGVAALEIEWLRDANGWNIKGLGFVHSRRLAYPDSESWALHIWDQGQVQGYTTRYDAPTQQVYGLTVEDYPGKFIVFAPQLRADYPTRDGIGREIATLMVLKRIIMRSSANDFERFQKPWVLAYYATKDDDKARAAEDADIQSANSVLESLGTGSLTGAVLPDSIKVELLKGGSDLKPDEFLEYIDAAMSKAALGQTFTVQSGKYGSRSTAEVGKGQALELARFDANALADVLERDLVKWIVKLNFPDQEHLAPKLKIMVEEIPDPAQIMALTKDAVMMGAPVDADKMAEKVGIDLVPNETAEERRLAPVKMIDVVALDAINRGEDPPAPVVAPLPGALPIPGEDKTPDPTDPEAEPSQDSP